IDPNVQTRRDRVLPRPWSWVRQVHGDRVVAVNGAGGVAGDVGDGLVAANPGCALAILTADCAPIALIGDNGVYGAAHGGWRGLLEGIVERTVDRMREAGAASVRAGPGAG